MPRRDPPNPYMGLRLGALGDQLMQRADDLLQGREATRRDIAYLLIAAGHSVRPRGGRPELPAERMAEGLSTPLDTFWPVYEAEQECLRWMVARQAMDAAGWLDGLDRDGLAGKGRGSDVALREVLGHIGRVFSARGGAGR